MDCRDDCWPTDAERFEILRHGLDGTQKLPLLDRERANRKSIGARFWNSKRGEQRERILAARHRHGHAIAVANHLETMDRFTGLAQQYFFDVHLFIVEADRPQREMAYPGRGTFPSAAVSANVGSVSMDIGLLLNQNSNLSPEDESLLTGLRAGCEDAYEELIQRYQTPVYNLAYRLLDDTGDACDVVQEVFLKVFRGVNQFRGQSTVKTWIYRIAVNEAHNRRRWLFRHRPNCVGLEETGLDDQLHERPIEYAGPSPFQVVFNSERQALIEQALADINPSFREALVLRETEDCSYEEIADILQISLGTVKSRILRGREALRKQLAGRVEPAPSFGWAPSR